MSCVHNWTKSEKKDSVAFRISKKKQRISKKKVRNNEASQTVSNLNIYNSGDAE